MDGDREVAEMGHGGGGGPLNAKASAPTLLCSHYLALCTTRHRSISGYVETCVFTYVVDVNTSHTPEEGALSPSWPNGLIIIIIISGLYNTIVTNHPQACLTCQSVQPLGGSPSLDWSFQQIT
jgi:hypothetical protein